MVHSPIILSQTTRLCFSAMAPKIYSAIPVEDGEEVYEEKFRLNYRKLRSCFWAYVYHLYLVILHFIVIALIALLYLSQWNHNPKVYKLLPSEIRKCTKFEHK